MAARAASPTGTEVVSTDDGHVGHGAVLASALCCLEDKPRCEINTWLAKVVSLLPSGKTLRFFPVTRTQSVLASIVRDIVARVRTHDIVINLIWLRNCETVRHLPLQAPFELETEGVKGGLPFLYRASALHVHHGCCTPGWSCGEDCGCMTSFFELLYSVQWDESKPSCGTELPVGDFGLFQFEAVAAWADLQTLLLLGKTLGSVELTTWVEAAGRSLFPHFEMIVADGKDPIGVHSGACSCEVIRG